MNLLSNLWGLSRQKALQKGFLLKNVSYGDFFAANLLEELQHKTYVNIGAGNFTLPGWTILDYDTPGYNYPSNLNFLQYDISSREALPFDDEAVDGAYCSHVLEHFSDDTIDFLLSEIERILVPGGICRVVVPDADLAFEALKRRDELFFIWDYWNSRADKYKAFAATAPGKWPIEFKWLHRFATERVPQDLTPSDCKIEISELQKAIRTQSFEDLHDLLISPLRYRYQYSSNHINWLNYGKIQRSASKCDKLSIQRSGYLQSQDPHMRVEGFFDQTWPQMSLFLEISKHHEK